MNLLCTPQVVHAGSRLKAHPFFEQAEYKCMKYKYMMYQACSFFEQAEQ